MRNLSTRLRLSTSRRPSAQPAAAAALEASAPVSDRDAQSNKTCAKIHASILQAKADFYRVLQAVDLYLLAFASAASASPEDIADVRLILEGFDLIGPWFTEACGEHLASAFDCCPAGFDFDAEGLLGAGVDDLGLLRHAHPPPKLPAGTDPNKEVTSPEGPDRAYSYEYVNFLRDSDDATVVPATFEPVYPQKSILFEGNGPAAGGHYRRLAEESRWPGPAGPGEPGNPDYAIDRPTSKTTARPKRRTGHRPRGKGHRRLPGP